MYVVAIASASAHGNPSVNHATGWQAWEQWVACLRTNSPCTVLAPSGQYLQFEAEPYKLCPHPALECNRARVSLFTKGPRGTEREARSLPYWARKGLQLTLLSPMGFERARGGGIRFEAWEAEPNPLLAQYYS